MPSTLSPPDSGDLPRQFASRDELNQLLAREFPDAEGDLSPIRGGRSAAEKKLISVDAKRYAGSRNHLNGAVTGLSPYIRHGVLTLAEVRDVVFQRIRRRDDGNKLVNELGWRPSIKIEDGLKKTVTWYLENEQWLRNVISGEYQTYYQTHCNKNI